MDAILGERKSSLLGVAPNWQVENAHPCPLRSVDFLLNLLPLGVHLGTFP